MRAIVEHPHDPSVVAEVEAFAADVYPDEPLTYEQKAARLYRALARFPRTLS